MSDKDKQSGLVSTNRRSFLKALGAAGLAGLAVTPGQASTSDDLFKHSHTSDDWLSVPENVEFLENRFLPAPKNGGFQRDNYHTAGADVIRGENKYHLYVNGFPDDLAYSDYWLTNNRIMHATADTPEGPFTFQNFVWNLDSSRWDRMRTNPVLTKKGDTYLLYYVGTTYDGDRPTADNPPSDGKWDQAYQNQAIGVATSDSAGGPWTRLDDPVITEFSDSEVAVNPVPIVKDDGTIIVLHKQRTPDFETHVVESQSYDGPYDRITEDPIIEEVEDATMWWADDRYKVIAKGLTGDTEKGAGYYTESTTSTLSVDTEWTESKFAYDRTIEWQDDTETEMYFLDRPQPLYIDGRYDSRATHAYFFTSADDYWANDPENVRTLAVPLKTPVYYYIGEDAPLDSSDSGEVTVVIPVEHNAVDPATGIDVSSVQFGAPDAVADGTAATPKNGGTVNSDGELVLTFDVQDMGFHDGPAGVAKLVADPSTDANEQFNEFYGYIDAPGAIVDNTDDGSSFTGSWSTSTNRDSYYGTNYTHDGDTGKGDKAVEFTPDLDYRDDYEVYAHWTAFSNRATGVPIDIDYDGGSDTVTVDQTQNGGQWNKLGTYTFTEGTSGSVTIRNDGTNGYVIADAVRLLPTKSTNYAITEGSGSTLYDDTGFARHGTINGPTWTTDSTSGGERAGENDTVLSFDGGSDHVETPDDHIRGASTFTQIVWVKLDDTSKDRAIQGRYSSDTSKQEQIVWYDVDNDCFQLVVHDDTGTEMRVENTGVSPPTGEWIQVAWTYDASGSLRLYQNGTETGSVSATGNPIANQQSGRQIGGDYGNHSNLVGAVHSLYEWNDVKDASFIAADYDQWIAKTVKLDNEDSTGVSVNGSWSTSTSSDGYVGSNYIHDQDSNKGSKSVEYTPDLGSAGEYEVYANWTSASNRATSVPIDIDYDGGSETVTVDQTKNGGEWNKLGTYSFTDGTGESLTIRNDNTSGYVVADAVAFVPR